MESEETTGESSYPAPVVPEITDIQKRLQQLCGGDSQDSQNMPEIILLPETKTKKKKKKKKKKNAVEFEGGEVNEHVPLTDTALSNQSIQEMESGALGFPPIHPELGQAENLSIDLNNETPVEVAQEESVVGQSVEESGILPNRGGFRGRGRAPFRGRWRGRRGYRRGGPPLLPGPPGPFGPPSGPLPPPQFHPGYQGQYDPSFNSYDYSQYYGLGGPPPPYSGPPMGNPQGPGSSFVPQDPSNWDQSSWGMSMPYPQAVDQNPHNSLPPPLPVEPQALPFINQPETPLVVAPSQQLPSIPIPPPPSEPPLPSSIPLPQSQPQPSASEIPLPPSDIPMPPSPSANVSSDQIPQEKTDSSTNLSFRKEKTLVDMDVPALSPAEPEEVKNVSECVMPSGEMSLVVETTPVVGMSPTAEILEAATKEEICDNKQSDHMVVDSKPETRKVDSFDNTGVENDSKNDTLNNKDLESEKHDDNQSKDNTQDKVPVKTTAQMLLEKIAMKKKASETAESGEVTESGAEGTKPKVFLKTGSKFLLKQLKQDAGKIQFSVKHGVTGPKKGNALQKPEKSEVEDASKQRGGARELYKPSDKDKEELLMETMTPKQRDSYLRYQEQRKREERRKQREVERETQKKEERDSKRNHRDKSESVEKEMDTSDTFSSPKTNLISEQLTDDKKIERKSEERTKDTSDQEEESVETELNNCDYSQASTISGTEIDDKQQSEILPQNTQTFSHNTCSDHSNPSLTSSKIHSVKIITIIKSKDAEPIQTEKKKKSRWSETKAETVLSSNPTISDDGPTTASVTTDTEAYNPDNPTESPKLSTTTGESEMNLPKKPTGMEYSPSHPTEDYSPSRPTNTPSPNRPEQVNQSSGAKDSALVSSAQAGTKLVLEEQSNKESENEDKSNKKSKKSKKKSKHAHRLASLSPDKGKNKRTKEKFGEASPKTKDSFSWDSDDDLVPVMKDSTQSNHSRSRSPASVDSKHKDSSKSDKKYNSGKHRKFSNSRSRSRSLDGRSRKQSISPRKRRSRSNSHSPSWESTRETYRKSDVKSRSSSKYKSRSRSRSSSKDSYLRKEKTASKSSKNRSRSRSADFDEDRGRMMKSSKRHSTKHSKSKSRSRSGSNDSIEAKYSKKTSSSWHRRKSLSPKNSKQSSHSRSRSVERTDKKKSKKKRSDSYSSSRSRSRSLDSSRKYNYKDRSISPKHKKSERKKKKHKHSPDRSRSPSFLNSKSERTKKSFERQSESPLSQRRGKKGSPSYSRNSSVSPYRRRRNSSSPESSKRSSSRKETHYRGSLSPYQSDRDGQKSNKTKDKSPQSSPKKSQDSEPEERIPREGSPDLSKESRPPISFKMNVSKPIKRELPSLSNKLENSIEKAVSETTESLTKKEISMEERLTEPLVATPPPSITSTLTIERSPEQRLSRSRSRSVDSSGDQKLSKKARKAAKKAKKKAKKLAKEKRRREKDEIETSNSSFNISTESLDIDENSVDVIKERISESKSREQIEDYRTEDRKKDPESPGSKKSGRSKMSNSDEESQQTSKEQCASTKHKTVTVDVCAIPLPGQELISETVKESSSCLEEKKPEEPMPTITDLSSIPMPGEEPIIVGKDSSSSAIPEKQFMVKGDVQSDLEDDTKPSAPKIVESNKEEKADNRALSITGKVTDSADASEIKEPGDLEQPQKSNANEEKIKRELKKLNIDMVKSTFDLEGYQPRRRSRRSFNSTEKDSESESNDSFKRTTRRYSKASNPAEDLSESENSQTELLQSGSETEKLNAEVIKENQETPVENPAKRKRKSRFSDVGNDADTSEISIPEKKTESGPIDMSPDPSTLPKLSVTLEPIRIEKGSIKTPIKFALSNVMNVISKVKWDDDDDEDLKTKPKLILGKDDPEVRFTAKQDDMAKSDDTESSELKDTKMTVKPDIPSIVTDPVLSKPRVPESAESNERMSVQREGKKPVRIDDIFQTALRKAKEIVDNKLMARVEEDKNISSDIPSGEDNIETVDMECDSNSNSQDAFIFQENDNFPQSSAPAPPPMTTFPKLSQGISIETMIPDFGMPLKDKPSSTEIKHLPPLHVPPPMDIPLPPPNPPQIPNFSIPPPRPIVPPSFAHTPTHIPIPLNVSSSLPVHYAPPIPISCPPPNIPLPQSTSLPVLPTDIPLPPPPPERSTSKEGIKTSSFILPPTAEQPPLPSDIPIPPVTKVNPSDVPMPAEQAFVLPSKDKVRNAPVDSAVAPLPECVSLPSEVIPSTSRLSKVSESNEPIKIGKFENPSTYLSNQQNISVKKESTLFDSSSENVEPTEKNAGAGKEESAMKAEGKLCDASDEHAENTPKEIEKASSIDIPHKSSIELSKQALLAKVSSKQKDSSKEKKITIGRISYTPFAEKSTEKSKDGSESSLPIKKTPMIKIGPIIMNKGKDLDTVIGESSEDGEVKSELESEDPNRHRGPFESLRNIPISPLVSEKSHEHSNPTSSGFGLLPKKDPHPSMWMSDNPKAEIPTNPTSSASESEDSRYDDQEYYKKVDEFLKKVEKPKTTVERKFDEFLEKVRKPKPESPSLEEKVDEFLKKTEKKDSRGSSYDEYKSSKHEKDDFDKHRERDHRERDRKEREYRERDKDKDHRDKDSRDRDRKRRDRDREYDDRRRDREHEDRHRSRDREHEDIHRSRDRDYEDRHRDRDREHEDRHRSRDREYEDRHRDREYEDRHRELDERHRRRERRGSRERSRSRERYREKVRERSRERSRSRSRSRSRDRERRNYDKRGKRSRHEREERRRRDSSDEEQSPRHKSRQSKSDRGEEKEKKNLTDEWLKLESQLAAKKKMLAEAGVSITTPQPQQTAAQPAQPEYYQDAYGNYYPLPANQANTMSAYPKYPQYPSSDQNTGYPPPPQPQVYSHDAYPPLQPTLPQASHVYNVPNTPVYNTQGQPIQQGIPYGLETPLRPPVQSTPTAAPRAAVVYGQVPTQPSILSAISSPAGVPPSSTLPPSLHVNTPGYRGPPRPVVPNIAASQPEVGAVRPISMPLQPGAPRFPSQVPSTLVRPQRVGSPSLFSAPVRPKGFIPPQTTVDVRGAEDTTPTPSEEDEEESATADEKGEEAEPQPSQSVTTSEDSPQPTHNVNRHLPIKLGFKQAIKDIELGQHPPPPTSPQVKDGKPEKVKSRWRRCSELDLESPARNTMSPSMDANSVSSSTSQSETENVDEKDFFVIKKVVENYDAWDPSCDLPVLASTIITRNEAQKKEKNEKEKQTVQNADTTTSLVTETKTEEEDKASKRPPFEPIEDNIYLCERKKNKKMKDVRRMVCDCSTSKEDRDMGYEACGEDCLNRMLYIECGNRCPCGEYCINKRFQKKQYADVEAFVTDWKGMGLRATAALQPGDFVMEYVGEVLDYKQFKSRVKQQAKMGQEHHYFMALNSDEVIDASYKGNVSRYMNHSCDPNCETQKWTVNGVLRVGFFVKKAVEPLTELNFDYQFERYGKEAQKCFCGSENCRGFIGGNKTTPLRSTRRHEEERKKKVDFEDDLLDEELEAITALENGLRNKDHVLNICRLMVRAEDPEHRITILKCLQDTVEDNCLRLFLDYHGLELLWSWITDSKEGPEDVKIMILSLLKKLPITNKNILKDSKILPLICRLAGRDENDDLSTVTNPMSSHLGHKGETKSILSTSAGKDRSQKKRVKFADEASSSDNESHSSITDTAGDTASGELELEVGPRPKSESLYKQVLDKSLGEEANTDQEGNAEVSMSSVDSTNKEEEEEEKKSEVSEEVKDVSEEVKDVSDGEVRSEENIVSESKEKLVSESEENTASDGKEGKMEFEQEEVNEEVTEMKTDIELQAEELLFLWRDLKELFKIPKKQQVEERKRIEKELGMPKDKDLEILEMIQDKSKQRAAGWDTGIRKRKRPPPPPPPSLEDEERKVLLPTPPKISKAEHRKMFEARVKARDEMAIRERQQQEAFVNQFYSDPSNILYFNRTPNHPLYGLPPDQQLQILQSQPIEVQYQMVQGYNSQEVVEQYIDPNTGIPITVEQLQAMYQHQQQPEVMYTEDGQPIQQVWPQQQVQQQYVNAEGQLVSVHQVDQHLVYSGVSQQQLLAQSVEVSGTHTQVAQIPGQQVYLQQIGPYGTQTQLAVVPPVAIATTSTGDDDEPPPPPSPPKPKVEKLPPNWKSAKDSEGKAYYYHTVTRQTQWDPPTWDGVAPDDAMDLESPLYEEIVKGKSKKTTTAAADTSSEMAKKIKDTFRKTMSSYIVVCLNPFRKPDCKMGRITSTEDFKHLARKLTHHVMAKELKHCRHVEDLEVNENVKSKAKDYVKKYMGKFGSVYSKTGSPDI